MTATTNREKDTTAQHGSGLVFYHQKFSDSEVCALCLGEEGWPCHGRQIEELCALNADLLAALESHVEHIAVHDRACCRELEALGRTAIAQAKGETA